MLLNRRCFGCSGSFRAAKPAFPKTHANAIRVVKIMMIVLASLTLLIPLVLIHLLDILLLTSDMLEKTLKMQYEFTLPSRVIVSLTSHLQM
jgi:hypothetical protein